MSCESKTLDWANPAEALILGLGASGRASAFMFSTSIFLASSAVIPATFSSSLLTCVVSLSYSAILASSLFFWALSCPFCDSRSRILRLSSPCCALSWFSRVLTALSFSRSSAFFAFTCFSCSLLSCRNFSLACSIFCCLMFSASICAFSTIVSACPLRMYLLTSIYTEMPTKAPANTAIT